MNGSEKAVGVLLVNAGHQVVAASEAAIELLGGRRRSTTQAPEVFLSRRLAEITSGRGQKNLPERGQFRFKDTAYSWERVPLRFFRADATETALEVVILQPASASGSDLKLLAERYSLSPREAETLRGIVAGLSTREIAARMNISTGTVKSFVRMLNVKIGASSRTEILSKLLVAIDLPAR